MKLYEIANYIETAIDGGYVIDEETGEVLFDAENLEELELAFNEKIENCALYTKNIQAEAEAIKAEEKRLKQRRESLERKAERMKAYIDYNMARMEVAKIDTPKVAVSFRNSQRVVIEDSSVLPDYYCKIETVMNPDKMKIKNAIKSGNHVPGAKIVESRNLIVK